MELGDAVPGTVVVHVVYSQPSQSEDGRARFQPNRGFSLSLEVLSFCRILKLY